MPKYMINILYRSPEAQSREPNRASTMAKYGEWSQKLAAKTIVAHKLNDVTGRTLRKQSGRIVDGPYAETKEGLGGFYLVNAANYEEAVEMAKGCPQLDYEGGHVEVREVEI